MYHGLFFTPSYGGLQYTGTCWHFAASLLFARQTADTRYQPSPRAEVLYQIKLFLLSWFPRPDRWRACDLLRQLQSSTVIRICSSPILEGSLYFNSLSVCFLLAALFTISRDPLSCAEIWASQDIEGRHWPVLVEDGMWASAFECSDSMKLSDYYAVMNIFAHSLFFFAVLIGENSPKMTCR